MSTYKLGNWLIDIKGNQRPLNTIFKIEDEYTRYRVADVKLWQPKPGDLVILKNKNDIISIIKYNGETNIYPFIGEITWLHKKD